MENIIPKKREKKCDRPKRVEKPPLLKVLESMIKKEILFVILRLKEILKFFWD